MFLILHYELDVVTRDRKVIAVSGTMVLVWNGYICPFSYPQCKNISSIGYENMSRGKIIQFHKIFPEGMTW